jgi:hypothetical protein
MLIGEMRPAVAGFSTSGAGDLLGSRELPRRRAFVSVTDVLVSAK